jgi:rhodanese-related sulfurtransferase
MSRDTARMHSMTHTESSARRLVPALAILLLMAAGCSGSEPESTACPVPSAPAETTPTACPVPTAPQQPLPQEGEAVCQGGTLSASQAFELLSDPAMDITIIDTRTAAEYEDGHIAGALQLSSSSASFDEKLDALPREGTYIVYCRHGNVSEGVVAQMLDMGFDHVCHIGTGFSGWQSEGLPVEKGAA